MLHFYRLPWQQLAVACSWPSLGASRHCWHESAQWLEWSWSAIASGQALSVASLRKAEKKWQGETQKIPNERIESLSGGLPSRGCREACERTSKGRETYGASPILGQGLLGVWREPHLWSLRSAQPTSWPGTRSGASAGSWGAPSLTGSTLGKAKSRGFGKPKGNPL